MPGEALRKAGECISCSGIVSDPLTVSSWSRVGALDLPPVVLGMLSRGGADAPTKMVRGGFSVSGQGHEWCVQLGELLRYTPPSA